MARFGLKNRLAKLENKRFAEYGTQLAVEYECDASGTPTDAFMRDWLSGLAPAKKVQQRADLPPSRPSSRGSRVTVVDTGVDAETAGDLD